MRLVIDLIQIFFVISLAQGCTHDKLLDVAKTYRKTLKFNVNDEESIGTFSARKRLSYKLDIFTPQKPNLVKITSCHQEKIFIRPGKELNFRYAPNPDIEANNLPCLIEISVLEESGKNQWGIIDFQLETETLPAKVACNGDRLNVSGSYICQSRENLIQEIEFDRDVRVLNPEGCNKIKTEDKRKFFYQTTEAMCFYLFADTKNQMFRLVTFGYNEIILDD